MGLAEYSIPEEKLPDCWSDEVRMNALFAPFRPKSANPESWTAKVKFWSDMFRVWCRCRRSPIVSAADAKAAFQRKGRTPACVDIVVEEMFRNGDLSPISKYQQILHNGPEGWVRWGARLAFKPAAFALVAVSSFLPSRQVFDSDGLPKASIDSTQRFVLESAVQEQATDLLHNYPPGVERIGTIDELMKNCEWQLGRETFEVLLGYLVSKGSAVKKGDVVKLAEPEKKASPVTESDEALVKLVSAETRLAGDATRLSRDVSLAEADARAAMQLGNKLAAKNHLRRKHKAQQRLMRCEATLDNVRQLLHQMKEADINAAVVSTYKTTSDAMKRDMKDRGLEEDAVHDTMNDLQEVMDSYNEIEKALSTTIDDFDVAELEQELKDLLTPGGGAGGTPGRDKKTEDTRMPSKPIAQPRVPKSPLDREFVFDGEERVLAELNELGFDDASSKVKEMRKKIAVAESWGNNNKPESEESKPSKPSKAWYPPAAQTLKPDESWTNNNMDTSLKNMTECYKEVRQDERLHPGQEINIDFSKPPQFYNTDFQVQDHTLDSGVWLYNSKDNANTALGASTEYVSSESPGKSGSNFQMAPGGERKNSHAWPQEESVIEDLEKRLQKLRGYNL